MQHREGFWGTRLRTYTDDSMGKGRGKGDGGGKEGYL